MSLKKIGAVLVAIGIAFAAWPADSQPRKRTTSRVIVTKRSYLNAGTEVKPGERKFTDYVFPPTFSAHAYYDPAHQYRYPLPDSFWLPGTGSSFGGY